MTSTNFRLRKHADYQRVYKSGRKQFARQMAWFVAHRDAEAAARSETAGPRIGLTVPKALGKAVARNRIKRRLREAVRSALPLLSAPVDIILHPKRSVLDADFALIRREVETIFLAAQAAANKPAALPAQPKKPARRKPTEAAPRKSTVPRKHTDPAR